MKPELFSNMTARVSSRAGLLVALMASVLMVGCTGSMNDLQQYVAQVKARKGGRIPPIPQPKTFSTFNYQDQNLRSPFIPDTSFQQAAHIGMDTGLHPDMHRTRQYLEQFPLDSLKMMGTLTMNNITYALVRDSDGVVHRVKKGEYLGQNNGKIISITEAGIELREIVSNGLGGWMEREASLPLGE